MTQDRSVSVALKADVSGYVASMKRASLATKDLANDAQKSAAKHGQSWDKVGKGMLVTGGVIGAGVTMAVKSFTDFDASMSKAQAGTMATGSALKSLRAAAIDAGAKTQYSATEASDAITAMGKAGVDTKDILGGGLTGALSLAAAGQLDVADASEIAATAMNQFGLQGKDIPHIADLLAAGAGKAMGSVQDLAGALKFAGPTAKGLGISIEETTGTLAMFAQQGIKGEMAGTNLRGVLLTLTSPSGIVAKRMEDLGINVYDASGKFIGMKGAAGELQAKLGPLDEATRNAALGQIFGNEQVGAARILYEGGAGAIDTWTKKVNDAGFAAEQAAMLTDNLKGDVERLGGSLSSVLIVSGSATNGMLRSMTSNLQGVVDRYGALPGPVQQGALALGAVTAAALLTGGAMVTLVPKALAAQVALTNMGRSGAVAATAIKGLGIASTVALVGIPILDAAATKVSGTFGQLAPEALAASKALTQFATSGKASGGSADLINRHFDDLGNTINNVFSPELGHKVSAFFSSISPGNLTGFETSETNQSIEFFKTLDSGLATMVASGNAEQAAVLLRRVTDEATKQGYSVATVMAALPQLAAAQKAAGEAAGGAAGGTEKLTSAQTALKESATAAKEAIDAEVQSLQDAGLVVLSTRSAQRALKDAQVAATDALRKNGKGLDINKSKQRDNAAALDGQASAALNLAKSIYAETGSEAKMRASLVSSRSALVATGIKFGMTKAQANAYADSIIKIPKQHLTKVQIDKAAADAKITALKAQINAIRQGRKPGIDANTAAGRARIADLQRQINALRGKEVFIKTTHLNYTVTKSIRASQDARLGPKVATGGYITGPGTGTSDSIPALLSNGEFVINAASTKRIGLAALHSVNRFADGGPVGSPQHFATGGFVSADFSAITGRMPTSSPSAADITAMRLRQAKATTALHTAENALYKLRHTKGHTTRQVNAAEDRLANSRGTLRAATVRLRGAEAARNLATRPYSSRFHAAATKSNASTLAFLRNVDYLRKRGFGTLADQLVMQADDEAYTLASQAARSPAVRSRLSHDMNISVNREKSLALRQAAVEARYAPKVAALPRWALPQGVAASTYGARPAPGRIQSIVVKIGDRELTQIVSATVDGHTQQLVDGLVYGGN